MKSFYALVILALVSVNVCADDRNGLTFENWARDVSTGDFEKSLISANLENVVPLDQLLRSASEWKRCGGPPYQIPPKAQWPDVKKVLALIKELKAVRLLTNFEVVSTYRNPRLNACAHGSKSSAHTKAFAVDLVMVGDKSNQLLLCKFWKNKGRSWNMGLSRYPSNRIHIDTAGYRTWGKDFTRATSYCLNFQ
jgi:Peptidase M15